MPIEFNCQGCGTFIRTPDNSAGKKGKCPKCQTIVQIPAAAPAASFPPANPPASNPLGGNMAGGVVGFPAATPGNPYASPTSGYGAVQMAPPSGKVKAPAIALIVASTLSILGYLGYGVLNLAVVQNMRLPAAANEAEAAGQRVGFAIGVASPFLGIIPQAITIWGAISMLKLKSYGVAMTGAIISVIPCCSCLAIPFGIWALIVLMAPDVKQAFS